MSGTRFDYAHLNWCSAILKKRRTQNGRLATKAGRDSIQVTASLGFEGASYVPSGWDHAYQSC